MPDVWTPPPPVVRLVGTVTYRCAGCSEDIGTGAVMYPLDARGDMTPETRSYHPEHIPQEVNTDGS